MTTGNGMANGAHRNLKESLLKTSIMFICGGVAAKNKSEQRRSNGGSAGVALSAKPSGEGQRNGGENIAFEKYRKWR